MNKMAAEKSLNGDKQKGMKKTRERKVWFGECVHHPMEERCLCS